MNWIFENKEWLFSGIGVLVVTLIIAAVRRRSATNKQTQRSGNNSTNLQAGGDVKVDIKNDK